MKYLIILFMFPLIICGASSEEDLNPGPSKLAAASAPLRHSPPAGDMDTDPASPIIPLGERVFTPVSCETVLRTFALAIIFIILDRIYLA